MSKLLKVRIFSAIIVVILITFVIFQLRKNQVNLTPLSPQFRRAGSENPIITIFEYSDLACHSCALANSKLKNILSIYGDRIQVNFKHYPLTDIHRFSLDAAVFADCAGRQGKFWEFIDLLFENKEKWVNNENFKKEFESYAKKISLDFVQMEKCYLDPQSLKEVKDDISRGNFKGIDATPTFFINGKRAVGVGQMVNELRKLLLEEI